MKGLPSSILRLFICCQLVASGAAAQSFYFTGAFTNPKGNALAFVKMKPLSGSVQYQAGNTGEFGIPSFKKTDSVLCMLTGFDTTWVVLSHGIFKKIVLKPSAAFSEQLLRETRLSSMTKTLVPEAATEKDNQSQGESYAQLIENPFVNTRQSPSTGLVPNNNHAAYSNIRRFVMQGMQVPPNAVRIEELWNYLSPTIADAPTGNRTFSMAAGLIPCPWDSSHQLLMLNAVARKMSFDSLPPVNMVFLIDNSGSMEENNRLPLLKAGFKLLANHLRPKDRVAIVTYGGGAGIALPPTFGHEKEKIHEAIDNLVAGGSTPGSNGIHLAYELVTTNSFANGINKVILATDGDFNIGIIDDTELERMISGYRSTGVTLSCLGVGMGNYKDSKIEALARMGQGHFAYLDTEEEAQKVMLEELSENLYAVASEVSLQLQLNPEAVKRYKIIGYDNRMAALAAGNKMLAGSIIGSGQSVIAMVELERSTPLGNSILGDWTLQYRSNTADTVFQVERMELIDEQLQTESQLPSVKIAAALAWYGITLRNGKANKYQQLAAIENYANNAAAINPNYAGFLKLIEENKKLFAKPVPIKKGKHSKSKNRP